VKIVSGSTTAGVLGITYKLAKSYGFTTVGIAARQAESCELFPVDEKMIVGEKFGDESDVFLNSISRLIRIGGGEQAMRETKLAKEDPVLKEKITKVIEYDLPLLN
jgi:hypothetical protein